MKKFENLTDEDLLEKMKGIPDEYQSLVQETIEKEIQEGQHDQTDADRLVYLRQRLEDMQNGAYIRPDGKTALITAAHPDELYESSIDGLAGENVAQQIEQDRKRTSLKLAGVGLVALLFFAFISLSARNRAQAEAAAVLAETVSMPVVSASGAAPPETATPELVEAGTSLRAIGSLGATLQLGRPAAVELHFQKTEKVTALAVDPARISQRGEMPFDQEAMLSADAVAVWVQDTVLNYAIGIPDSLIQNLEEGDRIVLSTDTGHVLHFVLIETLTGNAYDSARYLSQDRVGMTLFSLPAAAADQVHFALANYDITSEDEQTFVQNKVDDIIYLTDEIALKVSPDIAYNHTLDGLVTIQVSGVITPQAGSLNSVSLSLSANDEQTPSTNLKVQNNRWSAEFVVTDSFLGAAVFAEFRAIPTNVVQQIYLGTFPALAQQLDLVFSETFWLPESGKASLNMQVRNTSAATVRLDPAFFSLEGGDAQLDYFIQPVLPILLEGQEAVFLELSFLAPDGRRNPQSTVILKAGDERWEIPFIPSARDVN